MAHRILAAVDDSPRAPHVLAAALEHARQTSAALRVLHVIAIPPEFPAAGHTVTGDPLPAYMRRVGEERLRELLRERSTSSSSTGNGPAAEANPFRAARLYYR